MKNRLLLFVKLVGVAATILFCFNLLNSEPKDEKKVEEPIVEHGDSALKDKEKDVVPETPKLQMQENVSRGLVAKMIALTFYDYSDLVQLDSDIEYDDVLEDQWYYPYVNAAKIYGWMEGNDQNQFRPLDPITVQEAYTVLERLAQGEVNLKFNYQEYDESQLIPYSAWIQLYNRFLETYAGDQSYETVYGIHKEEVIVLGTPTNCESLNSWQTATDRGIYSFDGLLLDAYIDKKIGVLVKGSQLLAVVDEIEDQPLLTNAYVTNINGDSIDIFVGGVHRKYESQNLSLDLVGQVVDIHLLGEAAEVEEIYTKKIEGKVLKVQSDVIELDSGIYSAAEDIKIYKTVNEDVRWENLSNILVGSNVTEFVLNDDEICAALITNEADLDQIRVVLHTSDFKSLVHDSVEITCNSNFSVEYGNQQKIYKQDESLMITRDENTDLFGVNRIYIKPLDAKGRLTLNSVQKSGGVPSYRGILEIDKEGNGYIVINEVNLEEYLYAVVPSEMPSSYGLEASKVQAITARSYAYNQMLSNRYHQYGAHVDDSVSCQVYNNISENETSIQAVEDTKKLGITYGGSVISASFFSTSCGFTANSGDVWANYATKEFPTSSPSYLQGKPQFQGETYTDLSDEEVFKKFIEDPSIPAYDSDFPWFRWRISMTKKEIQDSINHNLKDRFQANPKLIAVLDSNNYFKSRPVDSIGELVDLLIYKRGIGGNILEMIAVGTENTVKISTEYNIRYTIRPFRYGTNENIPIEREDGSVVASMSALPSAFFTIEKQMDDDGKISLVTFIGGGFGHGVGMSQNGVKGMVDQGFTSEEILKHFYDGITIKEIY